MSQRPIQLTSSALPATHADEIAELFELHHRRLRGLAYMILGDSETAEEIVMEAMLRTFSGWGRIRDRDRADVYVTRAVVNLCRSRIRRKAVEQRALGIMGRRRDEPPSWDPEEHETSRAVWSAVKDLPVRQRACIVLRYLHDLPEGAIAEILECSKGTVRSQLTRARRKLADSLGPVLDREVQR